MKMNELRVGFAWQTLTSENLGVAALAEANLAIARRAAERANVSLSCIEFCPTGPNDQLAKARGCEIAAPLSVKKILTGQSTYVTQLRGCDALLDIGAGDSFADIYGAKHFFFLSLSKVLALLTRVPLVLSPQTIGPFESPFMQRAATWLMRASTKVFARDGLSKQYLDRLGVHSNADEVIDVAFRLPFSPQPAKADGKVHVGVNVSGLLFNGGYTQNNQFGLKVDYKKLVHALLDHLVAREDVVVHLVGHVISHDFAVEDDYRVIQDLQRSYPKFLVAPRFGSPSEAKSYISGLDFFTGARMHACIGAFSSGTPVVPMAYSRKFNGLFESLGYQHIADLKNHDNEQALTAILTGLENRAGLKLEVTRGNEIAQSKLQRYEDYLTELFMSLRPSPSAART
jgi:colanic acid/amylovoran biosynthesis protein